ncbi:RNA-binding motif protein, X-linked 2-like [Octopus sinensis]|uniref:RNA-binding motif protein, X-linked 2-like n=1 Tax=Octopus sinensis TaxID=2607531 RepID=A0A6P7TNY6_9MOLL|nr:RNA-binding motif protein, X-linked 2-like [Octopus sinensis]
MAHKGAFEAVDRTSRDIKNCEELLFGGAIVVLADIGNGAITSDIQDQKISLPEELCIYVNTAEELFSSVYSELSEHYRNFDWLRERAILAPLNDELKKIKNIQKISEKSIDFLGKGSWHEQYRNSAWIFVGGLSYDLTEGDVLCVFSQYGEIVTINLIRDRKTGRSKGYCFICYQDQRSTDLAVDNFNGIQILSRTIKVDHVENYRIPEEHEEDDELTKKLKFEGLLGINEKEIFNSKNKRHRSNKH